MKKIQHGKRIRFFRVAFILTILVGGFTLPVQAQGETPEPLPDLLTPVDDLAPMGAVMDAVGEVIRNRRTEVNTGLVVQLARSGSQQVGDGQPDFTFNLFVDVSYPAYVRGVEEMFNGAVGVYGVLSDNPVSEFVLVAQNGIVHAYLQDGIDTYEIRYQDGGQVIVEVDASVYPESLPPLAGPGGASSVGIQADQVTAQDIGDVIDVLGVYTPRAKNAVGGLDAIEARILASIDSANLGYANSGVAQRVRLVGMEEVNYDEILTGVSDIDMWYAALDRLTFGRYDTDPSTANYLSDARAYREAYGADLVFMLTDLPYAACGIGWLGGHPGDSELGYSVVHWLCSGSAAYTVQHEMGHNMGACHDRDNTNDSSFCYSADYSFGYQQPAAGFYTVMAYSCDGCGRINYWSNPNVSYAGYATGQDLGSDFPAYNTLTLNNTAYAVANYRQSVLFDARFVLSGAPGTLQYPRTILAVEASSPDGDIVQVTFRAEYDGTWHTLGTDTNPADGWTHHWNTLSLENQIISLQAVVQDSAGKIKTITLNNIALVSSITTIAGYTAREVGRGEVLDTAPQSTVFQLDTGGVVGLEPIRVEAAILEEIVAQYWTSPVRLLPVKYLSLLK